MTSIEIVVPPPPPAAAPPEPATTSRRGRPQVPSHKRKEATTAESIEVIGVAEKPKKKKAGTRKGDMENVDEEQVAPPEGADDPDAIKHKKKEKESKDKACKWLRAEQVDAGKEALKGRAHIVTTNCLHLKRSTNSGAPPDTQNLVPGDRVTVWTEKAALRKAEWVVYRIEKGAQADHWQIRCRFGDEASLTTFLLPTSRASPRASTRRRSMSAHHSLR